MTAPKIKYYTKTELDRHRFFNLIIATTGLENPKDETFLKLDNACSKCQAGRQFRIPFKVRQNTMGKKLVDQNQRYGFLIFQNSLVEKIKQENLTGIDFHKVEMGRNNTDFKYGEITNELPPMSAESVIKKSDVCTKCKRSGHYSNYDKIDQMVFSKTILDNLELDFYKTWEYYGIWDMGQNLQTIIVSKRVRELLESLKLRHIKFEPIFEL